MACQPITKAKCGQINWALHPSEDFETILKTLMGKYGNGHVENFTVKTKVGVEYEQIKASWSFPAALLSIERFGKTINKGNVFLMSREGLDESWEEHKKKENELKKGL